MNDHDYPGGDLNDDGHVDSTEHLLWLHAFDQLGEDEEPILASGDPNDDGCLRALLIFVAIAFVIALIFLYL